MLDMIKIENITGFLVTIPNFLCFVLSLIITHNGRVSFTVCTCFIRMLRFLNLNLMDMDSSQMILHLVSIS